MQVEHRRFFVPFLKVDEARRTVWGIAQSESVDTQDDLLSYEASVSAFAAWQGNIREQHDDSKAVGKAIQVIGDPKARTITVGAKISLGAEDTWLKVLDGTLTGFSIGGVIQEAQLVHSDEFNRTIRKVTQYELYELSLVDVPANSKCVITAVQKRGGHLVATDVLGQSTGALTVSDLLTSLNKQKASQSMPNKKRAKVQPVVAFAKTMKPEDEVVLVRVSDMQKSADGKTIILKGNAPVSGPMRKDDFDADGYSDDSDDTSGDDSPAEIDFGKHAEDAAQIHKSMCKMAGIDDDEKHYIEATADDKDGDGIDDDKEASKSRGARTRRRAREREVSIAKSAAQSASDAKLDTLTKQVEELTKALAGKVSGAPAPRVGGESIAEVVEKGRAVVTSDDERTEKSTRLADLKKQQGNLARKGPKNFTDADRALGKSLNDEVMQLEVELNARAPRLG